MFYRSQKAKDRVATAGGTSDPWIQTIREAAIPLSGPAGNYDELLNLVGQSRYVLLGEASHGTREFYRARAEITRRLIREKGFTVIGWEADWPDALQVNRFVRNGADALTALSAFKRFPTWMWRNTEVLEFVRWLQNQNSHLPPDTPKAGIYGLDLYSLHSSMNAVITYLQKTDPAAADAARERYSCFEQFGENPEDYGQMTARFDNPSCEEEVVQQLLELQRHEADFLRQDGPIAAEELFFAEQNARVAVSAEHYYRALYRGRQNTWNLRDSHMVESLENVMAHMEQCGRLPKVVLWAHNSHLGDARATEMAGQGEWNVGQLIKEKHGRDAVAIGFTTFSGTVTAAKEWGAAPERKTVRPALAGSYETLFHDVGIPNFFLRLRDNPSLAGEFRQPLLERAIGVIYRPQTERWSHYFEADLARQFDAVIHFDRTQAVEPLEINAEWQTDEFPETYPSGV